ncbi:hypothetical protein K7432_006078 [Basidiobolus ranarum]|uniref:Glycoside hydrolase family 32 protein n=1 Tax=Basidiobolus ranarum TaxID=34480 RepID=A0ABR2W2L2_9FUNG
MSPRPFKLLLLVAAVSSVIAESDFEQPDSLGFTKYRPSYHFQPPKNWMNDPCAPMKTPDGRYHLFYQYNPYDAIWGNMTWGHASSSDLLHWKDEENALKPDQPYDHLGIFSGSGITKGYKGKPTVGYTAVSKLPISWKIDYSLESEQQALAYTEDNGTSWKKLGVVIKSPPETTRTGFRDPFLFRSSHFDSMLPSNGQENIYMSVSGGTNATTKGGKLWLYKSQDWINWELFPTPFFQAKGDQPLSKTSEFTYGHNWEMANYFVLNESNNTEWHVLVIGVEGKSPYNTIRWPAWVAGHIVSTDKGKGVEFKPMMSGILDNGIDYADNSFFDPTTDQRVIWGWVTEDDADNEEIRKSQGWAGMLTVPRELFIYEKSGILSSKNLQKYAGSLTITSGKSKLKTVKTLGVRPIQDLVHLRDKAQVKIQNYKLDRHHVKSNRLTSGKRSYEISTVFNFAQDQKAQAGITLMRSADGREETKILYNPVTANLTIDRSKSSLNSNYSNTIQWGEIPLFRTRKGLERLELRVFVDNSIIEVFANDRLALTTRIYPTLPDSTEVFLTLAKGKKVTVEEFTLWPITDRAFPERKH